MKKTSHIGMGAALLALWLAGFSAQAWAQATEKLYRNIIQIADFSETDSNWALPKSADKTKPHTTIVDADAGIYHKAASFKLVTNEKSQPWSIAAVYHIKEPIMQGDDMAFKFWARSPESCKIGPMMEERQPPFQKSMGRLITLTPDWTEYEVRGVAKRDYEAGKSHITIYMGYGSGVVELTGVRLYLGKLPAVVDGQTLIPEELELTGLPGLATPNVLKNSDFAKDLAEWEGLDNAERSKATFFNIKDPRFSRYLNVVTTPRVGDKPWSVAPRQKIDAPIKKGETVVVRVWLRSPQSGKAAIIVEQNKAPFTKIVDNLLRLTPQWKQYEVRGVASQDFPAGATRLSLYLAFEPFTVDFANMQLFKVP